MTTRTRQRRSPHEVDELILDAARALFRAHGFDATSTRAIAEHAGVAESMIFRRYETKNALFEQAVLAPFLVYLDEFTERWRRQPPESEPETVALRYVTGLYGLFRENRDLLALIVAGRHGAAEAAAGADFLPSLDVHLQGLTDQVVEVLDRRGVVLAVDPALAVRFAQDVVFGAAVTGSGGAADERTLAELTAFVLRGVGYTPDLGPLGLDADA